MAIENIPFGLADITVEGPGGETISFNGKDYLQVEGGELSFEASYADIQFADFGDSLYDQIVQGYTGTVSFSAGQSDLKVMKAAMSYLDEIVNTETPAVAVGLMDAKIGTSMRARGAKVTIHPRTMGADKSMDIVVYKMAATGQFSRSYANEQGSIAIEYSMFPRDGFDVSKPGNFFYIGGTDPNPVVAP